jgi:hypothetical protein
MLIYTKKLWYRYFTTFETKKVFVNFQFFPLYIIHLQVVPAEISSQLENIKHK